MKIFLFHRVSPEINKSWPPMKPQTFEKIVKYISKKYLVVNLEKYLQNKNEFSQTKKNIASIVFDDGYIDFLNYAMPILSRFKIHPSMYVVTQCVETQKPIWTYILDNTVLNSEKKISKKYFELCKAPFSNLSSKNQKLQFAKHFKSYLKKIDDSIRKQICRDFFSYHNDIEFENMYMSWHDLNSIKNEVIIGSHTHTHPMLGNCLDADSIRKELSLSFSLIKKNLNFEPLSISYPNGSFNNEVKDLAKICGYKYGLSVENNVVDFKIYDKFQIPRIELYEENLIKRVARRNGLIDRIKSYI